MADINWSAEAKRDLKSIAEYFDASSPEYSKYIIEKLYNSVSYLEDNPSLGRQIPEFELKIFRELIVEGYRIMYLFQGKSKDIITIVHSRHDIIKHLKKS